MKITRARIRHLACSTRIPMASIALVAAMASPSQLLAATDTATVNVSASVNSQCNVQTTTLDMGFGTVLVNATGGVNAPVTLRVQCNKGAQPSITADAGANAAGAQRRMSNTTDTLNYSILQPTGGDFDTCPATIAAGTSLDATPLDVKSLWSTSGGPRDITLCGRLETPQVGASQGAYSDTVTVTVTY